MAEGVPAEEKEGSTAKTSVSEQEETGEPQTEMEQSNSMEKSDSVEKNANGTENGDLKDVVSETPSDDGSDDPKQKCCRVEYIYISIALILGAVLLGVMVYFTVLNTTKMDPLPVSDLEGDSVARQGAGDSFMTTETLETTTEKSVTSPSLTQMGRGARIGGLQGRMPAVPSFTNIFIGSGSKDTKAPSESQNEPVKTTIRSPSPTTTTKAPVKTAPVSPTTATKAPTTTTTVSPTTNTKIPQTRTTVPTVRVVTNAVQTTRKSPIPEGGGIPKSWLRGGLLRP